MGDELPPEPAPPRRAVRDDRPAGWPSRPHGARDLRAHSLDAEDGQPHLAHEPPDGGTDLIKRRTASWIEDAFWGPRYAIALSFNDVRPRALFPLYFEHRDRVLRLADDPSQLVLNFRDADHLKIYDVYPATARRRLSETLDSTEEVTHFLDRSEGITPRS